MGKRKRGRGPLDSAGRKDRRNDRHYSMLAVAAALCASWALVALSSLRFWSRTLDDAWITFRFGRNLLDGYGLHWNPLDAAPFEAYTSFLHVLLSSLFLAAGINPVTGSKILGVTCSLAIPLIFALYACRSNLSTAAMALFLLAYGANILSGFHAVTGMETAVFVLLVTSSTIVLVAVSEGRLRPWVLCAVFLAGIITRPDAGLLFACYYFYLLLGGTDDRKGLLRATLFILLLPGLVYAGFKLLYFGHLLPNSFRFKVGAGGELLPGRVYVRGFVLGNLVLPLVAWVFLHLKKCVPRRDLIIMTSLGISILFYVLVKPQVGVGYRFLFPYLPSVLIVVALAWHRYSSREKEKRDHRRVLGFAVIALFVLYAAGFSLVEYEALHRYMVPRAVNPAIGEALAGLEEPQGIILATGEAGAVPYYSNMFHLDFLGLTSEEGINAGGNPAWIFNYPVDVIVTHSIAFTTSDVGRYIPDPDSSRLARKRPLSTANLSYRLLREERFGEFDLVAKIPYAFKPSPAEHYYCFVRKGFRHYDLLRKRFEGLKVPLEY